MLSKDIVLAYLYFISKYGYPPPAEDTPDYLKTTHSLGFSSVELEGIRADHLLAMYSQRSHIKAQLQELGLKCPYFCIVLPDIASCDEAERDRNLGLFEKGCDIAATLGAKGVLDNGPLPPYQFRDDIPVVRHYDEKILQTANLPEDLDWNHYWPALIDTYRAACDIAAGRGLTYQLHPCHGVLTATTDGFLYFHNAVKRDNLRFNFDTANLFIMRENLSLSLSRLTGLVDYIHMSDNRGTRVEHLSLGQGSIDWKPFFRTLSRLEFRGLFGLDIGGAETGLTNLDEAYLQSATWLTDHLKEYDLL